MNETYKSILKPLFDYFLALVILLILSPVLIIVTILLFFANNGKPFFTQWRPGKNEKLFRIIKFKTMNDKKDSDGNLLSDSERLTGIGHFVRKTSFDEIPQLFNILKGDMSFIGPRPFLPHYISYYTKIEQKRHAVKPGITGYAQVNGRNYLDWDSKLKFDVYYVENVSLALDFNIFIKTIIKVLSFKDVSTDPSKIQPPLHIVRGKDVQL